MKKKEANTPKPTAYSELAEMLLITGAIDKVQVTLTRLFEVDVADKTEYDDVTLRLLLHVRLAPEGVIRAKDISEQMQKSTSHISRLVERAVLGGSARAPHRSVGP